ncbi:hypothetical protein GCM10010168_37580 [Actinoplanes ianthinogenes]|uniref:DUF5666 domain-containing protein n=1 Tax=Actinoplanes ianthinogenes TaxID=122358 RepID=A0ABM7M513_9ACTN|nr:hypothetical protein [Actinoplanes ianthinogenes]BCJ46720.1 hypothetical protein Aiant_73770 [Actinoplanes ianthinogenes]GGR16098.1 hypothetical protein GCM10010168_37580 [Actinoplanes ianthinogenes]
MNRINEDTAILPTVPAPDDPEHEGLAKELAAAAPKKWWNKGTIGLGVGLLLMGGFLGGVHSQKQWGTSTAATSGFPGGGTRGSGNFPGGLSASGFPGFGQGAQGGTGTTAATAASAGTTGKVKLVNGKTIYVETADGTVVTVKTDGRTTVATAKKGKLSDVKAGDSVTVEGETGTDGSVTATSVTSQGK